MVPRSQSRTPGRHGTFDDCIARIPDIAGLGFDVVYLTPIHPIGRSNRKGRNNGLRAAPGDPGSLYAIGAAEGGHDAVHPQLGTLDDFRRFVRACAERGIEVALDFAVQCSPDHPWLKEHPDWFQRRPDGSIQYAENPPKKYEDILNPDFYCGDSEHLWTALRDVVLFWINQGVRIFRVDNPHTKPFPFWEWLIREVQAVDPNVIFLSEALYPAEGDEGAGKTRVQPVLHLFHLAHRQGRTAGLSQRAHALSRMRIFSAEFFTNTPDIPPLPSAVGRAVGV
jgi:starch synthase (maltosyl-transferring)